MANYTHNKFDSINSFIKYFEGSDYRFCSSNKSERGWCDTNSFNEALDNTKYGKNKKINLDIFAKLNKDFSKFENKIKFKKDVVGQQPIVANYLQGNPRSMYRKIKEVKKKKILNVLILGGANCYGSSNSIIQNAINNFKIVKILESKGYKCNVRLIFSSEHPGSDLSFQVEDIKIKNADERFNLVKMVNPLCSSSFFRRLWFRFTEVKHKERLSYGYGRTSQISEVKENFQKLNIKYDYLLPNLENQKIELSDEMLINNFDKTMEAYCL